MTRCLLAYAATEAEPIVEARDGPTRFADIEIDCHGVKWPQ